MATVTHHEDGRTTFAPDGPPDDLLSAALRPRIRTGVLRPRGGYVSARRLIGPAPWDVGRVVFIAAVAVAVGSFLLVRMIG